MAVVLGVGVVLGVKAVTGTGTQVPPSGPDQPALQVQLVTAELPTGDVALAGHALHERADDSFEYLPAEQGIHVVDPGLELSEICNDTLELSEICNHTSR